MALLPISIVLGVLCGLWFQITVWIPWLIAWVGFAAWASFFYAGGDNDMATLYRTHNLRHNA